MCFFMRITSWAGYKVGEYFVILLLIFWTRDINLILAISLWSLDFGNGEDGFCLVTVLIFVYPFGGVRDGDEEGKKIHFICCILGFSAASQLRESSYWLRHICESRFSDNFGEICELLRYMILAAYAAIALFLRKMVIVIPEKWQ